MPRAYGIDVGDGGVVAVPSPLALFAGASADAWLDRYLCNAATRTGVAVSLDNAHRLRFDVYTTFANTASREFRLSAVVC